MKRLFVSIITVFLLVMSAAPALAKGSDTPPSTLPHITKAEIPACYQGTSQIGSDPAPCLDTVTCDAKDLTCTWFCITASVECNYFYDGWEPGTFRWISILYSALDRSHWIMAKQKETIHRKNRQIAHLRAQIRRLRHR